MKLSQNERKENCRKKLYNKMRFKLGLCLKLLVGISLVLLSVIFIKQNEVSDFNVTIRPSQVSDAKNISGYQKQVEVEEGKSFDTESADSLAGNRIDGLPNITSSVRKERGINNSFNGDFDKESLIILEQISIANKNQKILNEDLFGPVTNKTVVIAIQVHNRITYLRQLIKSFSVASGIDNTLLIFSHDVWDENINYLIRSIDFCMTLQIFYPYSLQTHKHQFPGESSNDCSRDINKEQAMSSGCTNAAWPDLHGHYREAQFTQTKHHWWWKSNWIFNKIEATKSFTGLVLFLEEDHYVAEDFLHVLLLMEKEKHNKKYKVDILSLGTYLKKNTAKNNPKQAEVTEWISSKHNMGMALSRKEWNKIFGCRKRFCKFDDYNWDWSLQHISHHCLPEKLQVIMVKGPRVFHIGECGVHHKKSNCDSNTGLDKVKSIINSAQNYLFPEKLQFTVTALRKKPKEKKPNGGWGDKRDYELCMNFTLPNDNVR